MYQYALHNYEAEGYFAECQIAAKPCMSTSGVTVESMEQ